VKPEIKCPLQTIKFVYKAKGGVDLFKRFLSFLTHDIDYRLKEIYWTDGENEYLLHIRENLFGKITIVGFGISPVSSKHGGYTPKYAVISKESPTIPHKIKTFLRMAGFRVKEKLQSLCHSQLK